MQTTAITTARQSAFGDVRVVERSRGTAHPAPMSTRDRVAQSLLRRPDRASAGYVRR